MRLVSALFLTPLLHRRIDDFVTELSGADGPIVTRIFFGIEAAEKLAVRVRPIAQIIFRPHLRGVERQPERARLLLHPTERDIGKTPVFITATHVAVGADKPALLELLLWRGVRIP